MKKIIFAIIFYIVFFSSASANNYIENIFNWKKIKVFEYDLKNKDFIYKVSVNPNYNATSLKDLMEKNNWISAINWVFFCPKDYRECWWKDFTRNERYVEWLKYSWDLETWNRVVFAWDKENNPFLYQSWKINIYDEKKIYYWLANHPLILQDWIDKIPEFDELWLIDSKMKIKWTRNFICSNKEKNKIYNWLVYDISVPDLAEFLKNFWCYDALNLDAGATTSMIYNWRQISWPWRKLLDWIIIERKGLDTQKIREISKKALENIENKIENKTWIEKINYLTDLNKKLNSYKNNIYDKNSLKFYTEDLKQTWYKITLNDLKSLENIYLINYIYNLINNKIWEYKSLKIKEENNFDLMF